MRPQSSAVLIARIFAPGLADTRKVVTKHLPATFQQGANNHARYGINPGQPRWAGAPQQMSQYRFRLVIGRVRDRHALDAADGGGRSEKPIAQAARGIFQVPAVAAGLSGYIGAVRVKVKPQIPSERRHEAFVFVGFRTAQLMMKMQNVQPNPQMRPQFGEQAQQRH
jgi:hypothetical protein